MPTLSSKTASLGLIIGCIVFGLGSVIVARLHMGAYAVAFWRLAVAAVIFALLMRFFAQKLPKNPRAVGFALLSGVFLAFDLALWHESIYAVGPGISTLLNCLQIFWLSMMGVQQRGGVDKFYHGGEGIQFVAVAAQAFARQNGENGA